MARCKEHRVPQAHEARVAEQYVVAHRISGQHHDPGHIGVVVGRQDELGDKQQCQDAQVERKHFAG
jgi:hypothetical protein